MHYEKFADGTIKCIENEIPFELPKGWEWCRLINVSTEIIAGGDKPEIYSKDKTETNIIPIYSNGVENRGLYGYTNGARILEPSITISARGTIGFCCLRNEPFVPIIRLISITPILMNIIYLKSVFQVLIEKSEGSSIPQLTVPAIKPKLIPIPPIKEQNRITLKINELLSFVDTIESAKADFQSTIQLIKSKILDLAIRGKLVPQDPNDEPATVLLERIRAEKEKLIEQGKIKRDKKESFIFKGEDNSYYEKIGDSVTCIDDELPFEIPDSWAWARLENCCQKEIKRGKSPKYAEKSNVLVFAQKCNTKYDGINMDLALYLDESTLSKYSNDEYMLDLDTVINSTGTGTLGRVGVYRDSDNHRKLSVVVDSHVTVIRACKALNAIYCYYFLKTYQQELEKLGEGSTNQKELKPLTLKSFIVSIPPYTEQKRIVEHITTAFAILDNIEKSLS